MSDHGDRYTRFKFDFGSKSDVPAPRHEGMARAALGLQGSALPVPTVVASNAGPEGSIATMALTSCGRASPISQPPL
jgi:hypothetical protein